MSKLPLPPVPEVEYGGTLDSIRQRVDAYWYPPPDGIANPEEWALNSASFDQLLADRRALVKIATAVQARAESAEARITAIEAVLDEWRGDGTALDLADVLRAELREPVEEPQPEESLIDALDTLARVNDEVGEPPRPGDPISSGFQARPGERPMSPEAMTRVQAKAESSRLARGRAEAEAKTAIVGVGEPQPEPCATCGGSRWVPFPLPDADDTEKTARPCPSCVPPTTESEQR